MRSRGGGPFSFASRSSSLGLVVAVLVCSVLWGFLKDQGSFSWLVSGVGLFENHAFYEPLSFIFVTVDPRGVLFNCLAIWVSASLLEPEWGVRRVYLFAIAITAVSGLLAATFVWFVFPSFAEHLYPGATVMTSALWVASGWTLGKRPMSFWSIPATGNMLAGIGIAFVVVNAALNHPLVVVPDVFAIGLTYGYVRGWSLRPLWLRFQAWRIQSQMRRRSKNLRLVDDGRNTSRDSDKFIH